MIPDESGESLSLAPQAGRKAAAVNTLAGTGLTIGLTVVQAFVVVPLCLAYIGPELYGRWIAAAELLIWLQMLDGGLPNLLVQRAGAHAGRGDLAAAARWSSTTLVILLAIAGGLAGAMFLVAPLAAGYLEVGTTDNATFVAALRTASAAAVVQMMCNGALALASALQRTRMVSAALVAGAAASLVVSVALLLAGAGLWALVGGLLTRATVSTVGMVVFYSGLPGADSSWWRSPSRAVMRDIAGLVPYTAAASVAHVVANHSEVLLVAGILGPIPALAYALTRRAFDGVRGLLDAIAWAVSGGFAHLVAAADRHRARQVLANIVRTRFAVASVVVGMVVAVNEPFVTLLYGLSNFAGTPLMLAFGLNILLSGQSFLVAYLWRSTSHVREGSIAVSVEAVARVGAIVLGLLLAGAIGAPIAAAVVSAATLVWAWRALGVALPAGQVRRPSFALRWGPVVVLVIACTLALVSMPIAWTSVCLVAGVLGGLGGTAVLLVLPEEMVPARLSWVRSRG